MRITSISTLAILVVGGAIASCSAPGSNGSGTFTATGGNGAAVGGGPAGDTGGSTGDTGGGMGVGGTVVPGAGGTVVPGSGGTVVPGSGGAVTPGSGGAVTPGSGGAVTPGSGGAVTPGSGGAVTPGAGGAVTPGSGGAVTPGSGGADVGAGGTTGTGGEATAMGGQGGDPIDCSTLSGSGLPINQSGWLDASCNSIGMQGAWFCFTDEIETSTCIDGTPPWEEGSGMCLSGTSVVDPDYASWGGGIGLSLNETGGEDSVKTTYNATANGVVGYRLTLEGDSLGQSMRIGYSTHFPAGDNLTPFIEVGELTPGSPLTVEVVISDTVVPEAWDSIPNAGEYADPSAVYDLQIQFPGGDVDGQYSFCITSIEPITTGDIPVVDCNLSGAVGTLYGQYDTMDVGGYMIQNNVWNAAAAGHQNTTAYNASGGVAFVVHADTGYNVLSDANGRPGGYGSAVYGWHTDGAFHGGLSSARQLSSIGSIPTHWEHCTPAAGNWNAAYDIWLAPGGASPSGDTGTEFMIWTAQRDATPIGSEVGTASVNGANWEVWVGESAGAWQTISFRRITNTHVFDANIMDFFQAGTQYADYDMSHSLYGIQAGYEIWSTTNQNLNYTTATFSVSVQ
jgi:hypothetical protein